EVSEIRERAFERPLDAESWSAMTAELDALDALARRDVERQGVSPSRITVVRRAHLKYEGTEGSLLVPVLDEPAMRRAFEAAYRARFAFLMPERRILVEALSVEAIGAGEATGADDIAVATTPGEPVTTTRVYTAGAWREAPVFRRGSLAPGQRIDGPAIIVEANATTVIEPGWHGEVTARNHLVLERHEPRERALAGGTAPDPVL